MSLPGGPGRCRGQPYQARAFTRPASRLWEPRRAAAAPCSSAAAADSTANSAGSHHAAAGPAAGSATRSRPARVAERQGDQQHSCQQGKEPARRKAGWPPRMSGDQGEISRQASVVTTRAPRREASGGGAVGRQAAWTSAVFSAARASAAREQQGRRTAHESLARCTVQRVREDHLGGSAMTARGPGAVRAR